MRNYKVNRDIGWFGTDNPATPIAERLPFVVQTEGNIKYVNIGIVSAAHGSHVTGIAAGNAPEAITRPSCWRGNWPSGCGCRSKPAGSSG